MAARCRLMIVLMLAAEAFAAQMSTGQQAPASQAGTQQNAPAQASSTLKLSLHEAVLLGLKQNPQRVIAGILVSESDRNRDIARSALLPQVGLDGHAALSQYNLQAVEKSDVKPAGPYQFMEAGPSFSQTVLSFPQIRTYQIGREGARGARADEKTARETAVTAVVTQYLLVLRALATRDAANARVALAQRLFDQATALQKTGIGLNIDTVRANVELQTEKQNLIDAETDTKTTRYALAELLDLPREQEVEVTDQLSFFDLPTYEREALLDQAMQFRPEIASIASQQKVAKLSYEGARDQRLPQLGFSGFWYYQGEHFSDAIPAYTYELTLNIPLFTGGRIRAEQAKAKLEQQRIDENRRALEARIVREVKTAYEELIAARTAVDVATLAVKLAQEEVAQAERRFAAGVTTNVEVITAQDALARANDNQIDALFRFNVSRASLAQATGQIEAMYAK
jgi:outer membrane protein